MCCVLVYGNMSRSHMHTCVLYHAINQSINQIFVYLEKDYRSDTYADYHVYMNYEDRWWCSIKKKSNPLIKLFLSQPWVWSVSNFTFLATAYEDDGWPVLFLDISFSHLQCMVSVLIIAKLARGRRWSRNLEPNFCFGRVLYIKGQKGL